MGSGAKGRPRGGVPEAATTKVAKHSSRRHRQDVLSGISTVKRNSAPKAMSKVEVLRVLITVMMERR